MIQVDILLCEDQIAKEFVDALERHDLPEKFFYWFPLSIRAWINLCGDGAYRNYVRSHSVLQNNADEIVSTLPSEPIELISLGAGQGTKDFLIMEHLRKQGKYLNYRPVDASQGLLEIACQNAKDKNFACRGLKADLNNEFHLTKMQSTLDDKPRLIMMLGNTLGAFDPIKFTAKLDKIMRPQDFLILDGELFNHNDTLAGYDNPVNRQFAFGPLSSVGLSEPNDGRLEIKTDVDSRQPGLYRVRKHFQASRDLKIILAGETVQILSDANIEMSWSYKYDRDALIGLITSSGMQIAAEYLSDDKRFLTLLVKK
tara:strand:- start:294 stop:1232 length:939 start_codon:yes stop_codon:yes gene_type:complete